MERTYTRDQIQRAFAEWIKRAKDYGWNNLEDASDPDVSADYLVTLMEELS